MTFTHGSRARLTDYDLARFPGDTLFDRVARVVCHVGRLPRKELYEAWEVARRTRRWCRGGRVVDVAGGHGLLAHLMLLLDDSSPDAVIVDPHPPDSSRPLAEALVAEWPRLQRRVSNAIEDVRHVPFTPDDVVVSSHACGALTDTILQAASSARARVAVLPCCHDLAVSDAGPLAGWMDGPMSVDAMRAVRLGDRGYVVRTQSIPAEITPKNRLLIGWPSRQDLGQQAEPKP